MHTQFVFMWESVYFSVVKSPYFVASAKCLNLSMHVCGNTEWYTYVYFTAVTLSRMWVCNNNKSANNNNAMECSKRKIKKNGENYFYIVAEWVPIESIEAIEAIESCWVPTTIITNILQIELYARRTKKALVL